MIASKLVALLLASAAAEAQNAYYSGIVSEPASVRSAVSALDAYASSLKAGALYQSLASDLPIELQNDLENIGYIGPGLSSAFATLPSDAQAFWKSVEQVEQSLLQTTLAPTEVSALFSSNAAEGSAVLSYLSNLTTQPGVQSLLSKLPPGLDNDLFGLEILKPFIEKYGDGLPADVKSLINQIISYEESAWHFTATAAAESGLSIAFPSTTLTGGPFTVAATTGATAGGSGPAATGASSSSSTGAAPTGLGCHGSCRAMAGAMVGVALGAIAL